MPEMNDASERYDTVVRAFVDETRMEMGCTCNPNISIQWQEMDESSPTVGRYVVMVQHDEHCLRVERMKRDE